MSMVRDYIMMDICEEIRRNETWWIEFDLYWLHHSSWRKKWLLCPILVEKRVFNFNNHSFVMYLLWNFCSSCFAKDIEEVIFPERPPLLFFFFLIITHQNPLWPFLKEIPLCGLRSQPHKTWSRTREDEFWPSMLNNFDGPRAPL